MLLETNSQTGFALTAALGLIIFMIHQIYEVDPSSPHELARLALYFHSIWPLLISSYRQIKFGEELISCFACTIPKSRTIGLLGTIHRDGVDGFY